MPVAILPSSFVVGHSGLTWKELGWGYQRGLIGWQTPVEWAKKENITGSATPLETKLAEIDKSDAHLIGETLAALAASEPSRDEALTKRKWLLLLLEWGLSEEAHLPDPLAYVEMVYADFDYPPEVGAFVRYMPVTDGYASEAHTRDENEARLLSLWRAYVDRERHSLFPPSNTVGERRRPDPAP